jgi:peptide/nickel transport system permease protein
MGTARLVRAEVLSLKEREFILAARGLGLSDTSILIRHLIPNAIAPAIVNAVLGLSTAILAETALSFLGIGVQPPTPSWGNMLMEGKAALGVAWWLTVFPGAMIFLTVLSANIIGEELYGRSDH